MVVFCDFLPMDFSSLFQYQFFLPVFFFVLWGIVSWGWPVVSVVLLPLFFPFYFGFAKFSIAGVPFTVIEWMVYVTFIIYLIKSFLTWKRKSPLTHFFSSLRKKQGPYFSFVMPIVLIVSGLFLGLFQAVDLDNTIRILGIIKGWFIVPMLYFYLMQAVLPSLKSVRRCFEWYAISAFFLAVWGIAQFVFHFTTTPDGRVSGPFESANYLAFYLVPALIFVLIRLWHLFFIPHEYNGLVGLFRKVFHIEESYSAVALLWHGVFAIAMLFALYLTRSFGAFLGLFLAFFGYIFYHWFFSYWKLKGSRGLASIVVVFLVLTVFVSVFFAIGDPGKFRQMFNISGQSSSSVRLQVWQVSTQLIAKHPLLGIGAGRFQDEYAQEAENVLGKKPYEATMLHPHNIFFMFWLSAGIFGLIGFLWLIVLLFYNIFYTPGHDGVKRLALISGVMLTTILLHGMVDTPIWKNDLALQFWMIAGAIARLRNIA